MPPPEAAGSVVVVVVVVVVLLPPPPPALPNTSVRTKFTTANARSAITKPITPYKIVFLALAALVGSPWEVV